MKDLKEKLSKLHRFLLFKLYIASLLNTPMKTYN